VTRIGLVEPGKNLDQGRFTRTVLADQGMNFAFFNIKSGILQGNLPRKSLL
jgi:hypothetical protein